jgi:hypothetical protein
VVHEPGAQTVDRQRARDLAVADARVSIGQALTLLGSRLVDVHAQPESESESSEESPGPPWQVPNAAVPRGGLGQRQLAVLALGGLNTASGLSAGDVVTATGYRRPNVYPLLERLTELGYLEPVPEEQPTRWRRPQPADQ